MKPTDQFKKVIQEYLNEQAKTDDALAEKIKELTPEEWKQKKEDGTLPDQQKNIDDCCQYILNQVKKSGKEGFDDSEIFGMALHYYDEDKIDIGKPVEGVQIVTNHKIELSPEEIEAAKEKAKQDAIDEVYKAQRAKIEGKKYKEGKAKAAKEDKQPTVQTLF